MSLTPPREDLFYRRNDPADPRLGELSQRWDGSTPIEKALSLADVALLGWPDDRAIAQNRGRQGAAQGPDAIRAAFYRLAPGIDDSLKHLKLLDLGNLKIEGDSYACHESAAHLVRSVTKAGVLPILLGGGNDYAYADIVGLAQGLKEMARVGVVNIDAHLDVRDLTNGITSGTPYFRLLEHKPPLLRGEDFYEFGIQPQRNAAVHYQYVKGKGAEVIELATLQTRGAKKVFFECLSRLKKECGAIAVSLDMDAVRQSDAPGVSAPSPNGLSAEDVEGLAQLAGAESSVKLLSVYEVSPPLDHDGQTSALAATFLWNFLRARAQNL